MGKTTWGNVASRKWQAEDSWEGPSGGHGRCSQPSAMRNRKWKKPGLGGGHLWTPRDAGQHSRVPAHRTQATSWEQHSVRSTRHPILIVQWPCGLVGHQEPPRGREGSSLDPAAFPLGLSVRFPLDSISDGQASHAGGGDVFTNTVPGVVGAGWLCGHTGTPRGPRLVRQHRRPHQEHPAPGT